MLTIDHTEGLTPFLERLIDAAAAVIPDLRDSNVYIIGMELPKMRGLSIAGLDRLFEREARAAGKWHGRGVAVAVDRGNIYGPTFAIGRSEGLDERQADKLAREELAAVALHELAHSIATGGDGEDGILADGPEIGRAGFDSYLADKPLPERFKVTPPVAPWHGHGVDFVRCCGILCKRLSNVLPLTLGDIMPTDSYGLSEPKFYAAAMKCDGDLSFPASVSIAEILATPPGPVLRAQWRADVFGWFRRSPMGEPETAAAAAALALAP